MRKEVISIKAKDGTYISAVSCSMENESPKAVVIVSHGFGEHADSYLELAERLTQANCEALILNQRGHGSLSDSPKERKKLQGIIPSYQSFLDDIGSISEYIKQKSPNTPKVLYGHSMGGNIVVNYLLGCNQSDFACAILEAPWLGLCKEVNPFIAAMSKFLGGISPKIAVTNKLTISDITSDKIKADWIKNDPLYHNRISMRMFAGIKNGCEYALNNAQHLHIPTFIAAAKYEAIVSNKAIEEFVRKSGFEVTKKEYESCHAIHNDIKREDFYHDMTVFIRKWV